MEDDKLILEKAKFENQGSVGKRRHRGVSEAEARQWQMD
jgi:hypothetical protein